MGHTSQMVSAMFMSGESAEEKVNTHGMKTALGMTSIDSPLMRE